MTPSSNRPSERSLLASSSPRQSQARPLSPTQQPQGLPSSSSSSALWTPAKALLEANENGSRRSKVEVIADQVQSPSNEVVSPKSTFYIFLLTIVIGGLQLSWSTEFSQGTPFLLSLGMSKTLMSLVWIAGPLSGTIGQPIVGILSDNLRWKYGRRRPFIIGGGIAVMLSLFILSYSTDIVALVTGKSYETDSDWLKTKTIPLAVMFVYILDFSISVIQGAGRAFIVDNVPTYQQQVANAWAARSTGFGNIAGFILGSINLPRDLPFLGKTPFKALCACASIALVVTITPACLFVKEIDPNKDRTIERNPYESLHNDSEDMGLLGAELGANTLKSVGAFTSLKNMYSQTIAATSRLPPQIKLACKIQFFAWIGYFPMLFYATTYVGEMYKKEFFENRPANSPPLTKKEADALWQESTRVGTKALVIYSIISLALNIVLPMIIQPSYIKESEKEYKASSSNDMEFLDASALLNNIAPAAAAATTAGSSASMPSLSGHREKKPTIHSRFYYYLEKADNHVNRLRQAMIIPWLTVGRCWLISHVIFTLATFSTLWISTTHSAMAFVAILGIPWAHALWAPFVIISEEISRVKVKKAQLADGWDIPHAKKYAAYEHNSGIVLGIHNVFVALPQVISSLMSSILFKFYSAAPGDDEGLMYDDSIGWIFRFGGLFTLMAVYLSFQLKTSEQLDEEDNTTHDDHLD
ncbi:hypothetical protein NADFUDRAFT_84326 [Nadsonia fulvescens var. elongata DSM 6958]|uniref:MFS general substrate transporter n=1 Tax=Nadsonia fulvescens var. elongata DSM 6958 TaxID=857566 RepID=A0A1E3PE76_9ASCO|nr:hypothetical protein NADFUDRAFT_84326 [Nadsonia fulvescens var. elongata DSM 6958]